MKKLLTACIIGTISFTALGESVSAAPITAIGDTNSVPEGYEIVKTYDNSSKFGIQPFNEQTGPKFDVIPSIIDNEADEEVDLKIVSNQTQPVYDLRNIKTGEIVTQYKSDISVLAGKTGTSSDNASDSTYSVRAYATVFFIYSGEGNGYLHMDKVSWRYDVQDSNVQIVNQSHRLFQSGAGKTSGRAITQEKTVNPGATTSGTHLIRDWGWEPIFTSGGLWKYGIEMNATLKRLNNPYTWTMQLNVTTVSQIG